VLAAGTCPVPDYVPPLVRPVLPWARARAAAERQYRPADADAAL